MEVIASEFARMAGVSRAAVCGKIKNGTLILNSANKLDTDNPVNRSYLENKQTRMRFDLNTQKMESSVSSPGAVSFQEKTSGHQQIGKATQTQGNAAEALDMTVRELIVRHGSLDNIERYSKILRDLTVADERDQKVQERRLIQIPKDFVISRLFSFLDQLMNKLLDVPESVSDQVIALALADTESKRQDVINLLSDNLTRCIAGAKERIINELNGLKGKYEKQDTDMADSIQEIKDQVETIKE